MGLDPDIPLVGIKYLATETTSDELGRKWRDELRKNVVSPLRCKLSSFKDAESEDFLYVTPHRRFAVFLQKNQAPILTSRKAKKLAAVWSLLKNLDRRNCAQSGGLVAQLASLAKAVIASASEAKQYGLGTSKLCETDLKFFINLREQVRSRNAILKKRLNEESPTPKRRWDPLAQQQYLKVRTQFGIGSVINCSEEGILEIDLSQFPMKAYVHEKNAERVVAVLVVVVSSMSS
eukprot:jgi/Bigna1/130340/aug1.11_g5048